MVFVIFKCTKCGKVTYNECRHREKVAHKTYRCYRCGGASSYKQMKLFRIEEKVTDAQRKARMADLNELTELSLEEKQIYERLGREYIQVETEKTQASRERATKIVDVKLLKAENPNLDEEINDLTEEIGEKKQQLNDLKKIKKLII